MRVLVCGSRHFNNYELLESVLSEIPIELLIEGEARGADKLGRQYAERREIPFIPFPAKWTEFGKAAGPIRNREMLESGRPDLVVAFLAPDSRGTANMISQAEKAGVPVKVIHVEVR